MQESLNVVATLSEQQVFLTERYKSIQFENSKLVSEQNNQKQIVDNIHAEAKYIQDILDQEKQDHRDSVQMIHERIDPEGCIHSVGMKPSNMVSMVLNCVDVLLEKIKEQDSQIHCMIMAHSEEL